ncbi:outer membrane chaperone Skp (OmpH)-like protein [Salinisphaera sp. PC39]|uniref:OmpH family outer membrane protein n=1 Tax=Salinisphaera sp. PC39 TaxID=1304156 RepID=UPI003341F679
MTVKRIAFAAVLLAGLGLAMPAAAQQDLKIGVVNLARLVTESPQAQRARQNMEGQFASRMEELQERREKLQSDVERLKRDGSVMSDEARQKLEDSIRDQQRRLRLAQEEYNEDVQRAEQQEMQELRQDIREVIDTYAREQGYDLIVGDGILYAGERVDLTDKVLARLKDKM